MGSKILLLLLVFMPSISINSQWISKKDTLQLPVWGVGWSIDANTSGSTGIAVNTSGTNRISGIYSTANNGIVWTEIPSPFSPWGRSLAKIAISNNSNIWITTNDGNIYKTTNKGGSWQLQFFDTTKTKFMDYIKMFDDNNGIAMGDAVGNQSALFVKTTDGGNHWNVISNNLYGYISGDEWRRIDFVNMDIGYFFGNNNLVKTTDGGATWNKTNFPGDLWIVKFYDKNLGLTFSTDWTTSKNNFKRTTDGGNTWQEFQVSITGIGDDIEFLPGNPKCVWFTGSAGLFYSLDTGKTWQKSNLGDNNIYGRDIVFTNNNNGWLLCDNGKIFYTDNNGQLTVDIKENFSKNPNDYLLFQNYPNPFNPVSQINFTIPKASHVQLKIYDVFGREVEILVNGFLQEGNHSCQFNRKNLASGVYFYTLKACDYIDTKKMILMK